MTNEMLFHGGLFIAGAAVSAGIIFFIVMIFVYFNLQRKLDKEYGEKIK